MLDGRALGIPERIGPQAHLFRGAVTNLALLDRDGAERLRVAFDAPTRILLQDGRHWDGTALTLRFFFAEGTVKGGCRYEVRSTVRTPADGPLVLDEGRPVTLEAGVDWIPLANEPYVEPGSALDFSRVVPHHAPAGLLEWGGLPHLMRRGAAEIELQLSASARKSQTSANENGDANLDLPSVDKDDHFGWFDNSANAGWRVFRLSPSGRRIGEVSCAWQPADQALTSRASSGGFQRPSGDATGEAGTLRFTADTAIDPSSAMFLYEIVRDADPGFRRKTAEKR